MVHQNGSRPVMYCILRRSRNASRSVPDRTDGRSTLPVNFLPCGLAFFVSNDLRFLRFAEKALFNSKLELPGNLGNLFNFGRVPSNNELRSRLAHLDPLKLWPAVQMLLDALESSRAPMGSTILDGHYMVAFGCTDFLESGSFP